MSESLLTGVSRILQEEGVPLNGNTNYYDFNCPFHEDSSPSMRVNMVKRQISCFVCNLHFTGKNHGGDPLIEFEERITGKRVVIAPKLLDLDPVRELEGFWRFFPSPVTQGVLKFVIEEASGMNGGDLKECQARYGLTQDTLRAARIRSGVTLNMRKVLDRFSATELITSGVFNYKPEAPNHLAFYFWKRLIIPNYWDGAIVDCRSRVAFGQDEAAKYFGLRGHAPRPYFTPGVEESDWLVVTEGEFKALASYQHGAPAIGLPGLGQFRSIPLYMVRGKKVMVILDQQGRDHIEGKAAQAIARFLQESADQVRILELPRRGCKVGLDDYLKDGGRLKSLTQVPMEA